MTKIRHFIYDLDGTLDDSMPGYTKVFVEVLREVGITDKKLSSEFNNTAGLPLRQQFSNAGSTHGVPLDLEKCYARFRELTQQERTSPFPGTVPLIKEVHRRGGKQYITTGSKTTSATARMEELGLLPYFSLILGEGDGLDKGLPHLQLFKEHSGDADFKKKAIYLGDGPKDMQYAREFGVIAMGVSTTLPEYKLREAGAQYVIPALDQFLELIGKIEGEPDEGRRE